MESIRTVQYTNGAKIATKTPDEDVFDAALRVEGQVWPHSGVSAARGSLHPTCGSTVGTATDPSGTSIPNAEVTVTNDGTGGAQTQETNEIGAYSFTTLFPGSYSIRAVAPGFRPVDIRQIVLQVDQTARFYLALEIGQVTETVEVAATPVLATDMSAQAMSSRTGRSWTCL